MNLEVLPLMCSFLASVRFILRPTILNNQNQAGQIVSARLQRWQARGIDQNEHDVVMNSFNCSELKGKTHLQ